MGLRGIHRLCDKLARHRLADRFRGRAFLACYAIGAAARFILAGG
jgi:hypothetical protein